MISIAVVDEHKLLVESLQILFKDECGIKLVGSAATVAEGLEVIQRVFPRVLLLDVGPGSCNLEYIPQILRASPNTSVVLMTPGFDDAFLMRALNCGASAFFSKNSCFSELIATIERAAAGEIIIPADILMRMLKHNTRGRVVVTGQDRVWEQLTSRELEILRTLAQGKTGKEIANELSIAPLMVRTHIRNLMSKMGVHSRLEAVSFGLRNGLINT